MRRDEADKPEAEKVTPCARCGFPSECEIWESPACYPCAADWQEASPTYGQIGTQRAPTVYREFTAKWLKESKRGAA